MRFWQINLIIIGGILLSSCVSRKEISGNYENRFYISKVESPFFLLRGLNSLEFKYNIEFKKDSTYLVFNCLCNSEGKFSIKNDSIFLLNQTEQQDSVEPCFDSYSYKIRNNGKKLTRRNGNTLERLHKVK